MPIVIIDEAHNARTELSFTTLARFRPSCIIEFTATPAKEKNPSNILYTVSAADLKSAEMIKMPIQLSTRTDWKELLSDAIHCRHGLEKVSSLEQQQTGEYIRPIMLIQAQPKRQGQETLTVEVIKQSLITDHHIPEEQIVIATGSTRGLDDIDDILSPEEPTRYVITVQALKEGWDCPFAYVLCSVAESRSVTAIEQLLGRVMRLPKATWKSHDELNMAYAFATSNSFSEIAKTLTDALVSSGFDKQEAKDLIIPLKGEQKELPYTGRSFMGLVHVTMEEKPDVKELPEKLRKKVKYDQDKKELTFVGSMTETERDQLKSVCTSKKSKHGIEQAYNLSKGKPALPERVQTASEKGLRFDVPILSLQQGNLFEAFEETFFLEHEWHLSDCDALLTEEEYSAQRPESQAGEIDISEKGKVSAKFVSNLQNQMTLFANDQGWSVARLAHWLDQNIPHHDISPEETGIFLTRLIQSLIDQRGIPLERLVIDKFRLKKASSDKIDATDKTLETRHFKHSYSVLSRPYRYHLISAFHFLLIIESIATQRFIKGTMNSISTTTLKLVTLKVQEKNSSVLSTSINWTRSIIGFGIPSDAPNNHFGYRPLLISSTLILSAS